MGSRTTSGDRILKATNTTSIRHEGERLSEGRSSDDVVVSRIVNTSHRPPDGSPTRGE